MTGVRISMDYVLAIPRPPTGWTPGSYVPPEDRVSPAFAESDARYQDALAAYRRQDYPRAADGFVEAALVLRSVTTGIHADTAAFNRAVLLEDAAYAWLEAGTPDVGRATLARLEQSRQLTAADTRRARDALARHAR